MNNLIKNRICTWAVWLFPILCTGYINILIWTFIQIILLNRDIGKYSKHKRPMWEWDEFKEMNKPENLTEEEKNFIYPNGTFVKVGERSYVDAEQVLRDI